METIMGYLIGFVIVGIVLVFIYIFCKLTEINELKCKNNEIILDINHALEILKKDYREETRGIRERLPAYCKIADEYHIATLRNSIESVESRVRELEYKTKELKPRK